MGRPIDTGSAAGLRRPPGLPFTRWPVDQNVPGEEHVIEPLGRDPARWRFHGVSVRRERCAQRLRQALGVNDAGAALALDLLGEIELLRTRLHRFEES